MLSDLSGFKGQVLYNIRRQFRDFLPRENMYYHYNSFTYQGKEWCTMTNVIFVYAYRSMYWLSDCLSISDFHELNFSTKLCFSCLIYVLFLSNLFITKWFVMYISMYQFIFFEKWQFRSILMSFWNQHVVILFLPP